jgi:hypothetical protein
MVGVNKEGTGARAFAGAEYSSGRKNRHVAGFQPERRTEYNASQVQSRNYVTTPSSSLLRQLMTRRSRWLYSSRTAVLALSPQRRLPAWCFDYYSAGQTALTEPAAGRRGGTGRHGRGAITGCWQQLMRIVSWTRLIEHAGRTAVD